MEYIELWNITTQEIKDDFYMAPLVVGLIFLIKESIALYSRKRWGEKTFLFIFLNAISRPKYPLSKIFIPLGILSIIASGVIYINIQIKLSNTAKLFEDKNVEIIEGIVNVEFEQLAAGHTGGDIVHIDSKTFEIHYFYSTYFYNESIAHGGFLKQGEHVRIHYIPTTDDETWVFGDGKILKIEQKNTSHNS